MHETAATLGFTLKKEQEKVITRGLNFCWEFRASGRCRLVAAAATAVDAAKTVRASKLDRHAFPAYPVDGEGARTLNRLPRLWTLNRLPRVPLLLREVKLFYVMRHGCRMPRLP